MTLCDRYAPSREERTPRALKDARGPRCFLRAAALLVACAAPHPVRPPPLLGYATRALPSGTALEGTAGEQPARAGLPSALVTSLSAATQGPYTAASRSRPTAIALWTQPQGQGAYWYASRLSAGESSAEIASAEAIAPAPRELQQVVLRPLSTGFAAVFSSPAGAKSDGATLVQGLRLGPHGTALGPTELLAVSDRPVRWLDLRAAGPHTIALWASSSRDDAEASVQAITLPWGSSGPPPDSFQVARGVVAWQAATQDEQLALALIRRVSNSAGEREVVLGVSSATGTTSTEVVLERSATLAPVVDVTVAEQSWVVTWIDAGGLQPHLRVAVVGRTGELRVPPHTAAPNAGPQRLVTTLFDSAAAKGFLIWEDLSPFAAGVRRFEWAPIDSQGNAGPQRGQVLHWGDTEPEFVGSRGGVAALVRQPECNDATTCAPVPWYAEWDAQLGLLANAPIRLQALGGQAAAEAWGLRCGPECHALALVRGAVHEVALTHQPDGPRMATRTLTAAPAAPRPLLRIGPLLALEATPSPTGLLALIAAAGPTEGFEQADRRSTLYLLPWGNALSGAARPRPVARDVEARGPLALAIGTGGETLVAWVGREPGAARAEVLLERAQEDGKVTARRPLTEGAQQVVSLSAAATNDGFAVAWVDERRGSAQVLISTIKSNLDTHTPPRALPGQDGAVAVALAQTAGNRLLVATQRRQGSVQSIEIQALAASGMRQPTREVVAVDKGELVSLRIAPWQRGAAIAWLQQDSQRQARVWVQVVDDNGFLQGPPQEIVGLLGAAHSLRLACREHCQAVIETDSPLGTRFEWFDGVEADARRIALHWHRQLEHRSTVYALQPDALLDASAVGPGNTQVRWLAPEEPNMPPLLFTDWR